MLVIDITKVLNVKTQLTRNNHSHFSNFLHEIADHTLQAVSRILAAANNAG